jgi:hypothetical protein
MPQPSVLWDGDGGGWKTGATPNDAWEWNAWCSMTPVRRCAGIRESEGSEGSLRLPDSLDGGVGQERSRGWKVLVAASMHAHKHSALLFVPPCCLVRLLVCCLSLSFPLSAFVGPGTCGHCRPQVGAKGTTRAPGAAPDQRKQMHRRRREGDNDRTFSVHQRLCQPRPGKFAQRLVSRFLGAGSKSKTLR